MERASPGLMRIPGVARDVAQLEMSVPAESAYSPRQSATAEGQSKEGEVLLKDDVY